MEEEQSWCNKTDPPCPYKSPNCGIKRWLSYYPHPESRAKEVARLEKLAKEDPAALHRLCAKTVFGW